MKKDKDLAKKFWGNVDKQNEDLSNVKFTGIIHTIKARTHTIGYICPLCDKVNPDSQDYIVVDIIGEKMCEICKSKLRNLIGIKL